MPHLVRRYYLVVKDYPGHNQTGVPDLRARVEISAVLWSFKATAESFEV